MVLDFSWRKSEIESSNTQQAIFSECAYHFNGTHCRFCFFFFCFWVRCAFWGYMLLVVENVVNGRSFWCCRLQGWRGCMIRGKKTLTLALSWWRYKCRFFHQWLKPWCNWKNVLTENMVSSWFMQWFGPVFKTLVNSYHWITERSDIFIIIIFNFV